MTQVQRIKIPRMPDRAVINCFSKLGKKYNVTTLNISALAFAQIGAVDLSEEPNEEFEELLSHNSTLINTCSINISGLNIGYHRGGNYQPEQQSPIYDEILLNWNQQQGTATNKEKLAIVALINTELKAFEPGRFIDSGLSEEQIQLLSIHEGTLERLEQLNEDLVRKSAEFREQVEKKFETKRTELEDILKEKQDRLEQGYTKKSEILEVKEEVLAKKLEAIDDRDNTHVRREIRDKMLDDVRNRINNFGVSESTENKRRPVLIGILLLMLSSFSLMVFTGYEINTAEKTYIVSINKTSGNEEISSKSEQIASAIDTEKVKIYWLWARFALFSFALLGTVLYYIKWQNRWAEQHSASEFQLQQFYIDVNRANWVIESCLEWRKVTDSVIPSDLLGSITRNLFTTETKTLDQVTHPADELASALMGSASSLKLNLNGNELEFNKPGKITNKISRPKKSV